MKHLSLLFLLAYGAWGATPYQFGTTLRLADGAESLTVVHTENGVEQSYTVTVPLPLEGSAYQKVTAWGSRYFAPGKSEVLCPSPCQVQMPLHYGPPKLTVARYGANNAMVGRPGILSIPQYIPPPLNSYTMPIEMVGFEGFERTYVVNARSSANLSGAERLYLRIHRPAYEGKAQVRVNGGGWFDIRRSNVSVLGTHAKWEGVNSLDFGQSLLQIAINLPPDLVQSGLNTISFRFAKEARDQSGFRILEMNFLEPDQNVVAVSITGSTVNLNVPNHGYTSGDDVRIEAYPGIAWRVNGIHTVTVVDANNLQFDIPEADGKKNGAKLYSGVKIAKLVVNQADFVEENPDTWTAPAGANTTNGATRWAANDLLAPATPGQTITASCAECHSQNGLDLKYFNYSNRSIIVRSMFHGLTEQDGKDIAAWIRGNPSSNPGRPYNPVYQPCPNAVAVSAYDWAGACTYKDVLPNNAGMIEELFGETIETADWEPTRNGAHFAQQRIPLELLDWNDWLPLMHPKDTYTTSANAGIPLLYWPTSDPAGGYNSFRSIVSAACPGTNCVSTLLANHEALRLAINAMSGKRLTSGLSLSGLNPCQGAPADAECPNNTYSEANEASKRIYSVSLWSMAKVFEVMHEFDLEQYGKTVWWPRTQIDRNSFTSNPFQSSFNLAKATGANGTIPGMFDGTRATEKIMSLVWYQYQGIMNRDNNQKEVGTGMFNGIAPIDWPYTMGYFKDLAQLSIDLPLMSAQWIMQALQRYRNSSPNWEGLSTGYLWSSTLPAPLTGSDEWQMWEGLPSLDRNTWRSAIIDTLWTKQTNIYCGVEPNGTAPLFTIADWNDRSNARDITMPTKVNVQLGSGFQAFPSLLWHMIIMGRAFGVNTGTLDQLTSCAQQWTGPSATLGASIDASQTTIPLSSAPSQWTTGAFLMRIGNEDMECAARSGTTLTGCLRGRNGTTPTSHSSGATAQVVVRWSSARNDGTCNLLSDNLTVNASCYQTPTP
ncbi:MAG: hypothetical protein OHK0021_04880 [Bryobacter sp.]